MKRCTRPKHEWELVGFDSSVYVDIWGRSYNGGCVFECEHCSTVRALIPRGFFYENRYFINRDSMPKSWKPTLRLFPLL